MSRSSRGSQQLKAAAAAAQTRMLNAQAALVEAQVREANSPWWRRHAVALIAAVGGFVGSATPAAITALAQPAAEASIKTIQPSLADSPWGALPSVDERLQRMASELEGWDVVPTDRQTLRQMADTLHQARRRIGEGAPQLATLNEALNALQDRASSFDDAGTEPTSFLPGSPHSTRLAAMMEELVAYRSHVPQVIDYKRFIIKRVERKPPGE